jgi:hypothetical protein
MEKFLDITSTEAAEKHGKTPPNPPNDMPWLHVISRSYHPYLWWTLNSHASIDRYWSHQLLKWPASSNTMRLKILCTRSCPWHLRHQQGPKSQMSLLFMFFSMGTWEHTKCGWAYFGHLHTICTPCATKSDEKLSQAPLKNYAKSCQIPPKNWLPISGTKCLSSKAIQFASPCSALACATTSALMMFSNGVQKNKGR